jgi:hypothetical protein
MFLLLTFLGLRDLNSARLKITERYLLNCNEILATCYIGRATTDAGVMGVFELARRASLSRIGIICTKSDVSAEAAGWFFGSEGITNFGRAVLLTFHIGYSSGRSAARLGWRC